jgi:hypothetical protein
MFPRIGFMFPSMSPPRFIELIDQIHMLIVIKKNRGKLIIWICRIRLQFSITEIGYKILVVQFRRRIFIRNCKKDLVIPNFKYTELDIETN